MENAGWVVVQHLLHPLDLYWGREVKATKMVRRADDLVVLCRWKPPETYMPELRQFLAWLRVTVNEDKTRVVEAKDSFDFLGVHFRKQPSRRDASRWFCYCWPSQRSMQRIRDKVKAVIGRDDRPTLQEKLDRLNPILRGWLACFGWLNSAQHFRKVDQYVSGNFGVGCSRSTSKDGGPVALASKTHANIFLFFVDAKRFKIIKPKTIQTAVLNRSHGKPSSNQCQSRQRSR